MAESELYRKGAAIRRRLMGDAAVEQLGRTTYSDPVMKKFIDVATETVFGLDLNPSPRLRRLRRRHRARA